MYQDFRRTFCENNPLYLKPKELIEKGTLYVIDTARHPKNISGEKEVLLLTLTLIRL